MTTSGLEPLASALAAFPAVLPALLILLKITCLLVAALGATLLMQRASAGSRHLVWLAALAGLLVLPALAAWGPLQLHVLPATLAPAGPVMPLTSAERVDPVAPIDEAAPPAPAGSRTAPVTTPWAGASLDVGTVLLGIWAVVALGLIARLAYGAWSVRRIVRGARHLEQPAWQTPLYEIADRLGLDAAPQLLQSDEVRMPFAAGLFASRIVLPADSESWSADRRSAVLIHELGHVRRRDLIGHTLSRIVCALYWFHPLVWTAARRLRAESERACDDLALVFGARPSDYAEHLLDIVTCVRDHNTPAVALAMAHRKEFEGRMLAILNPELRRRGPSRMETASLVGSLAVLALVVGAAAPVPRTAVTPQAATPVRHLAPVTLVDSATPSVPLPASSPRPAAQPRPVAVPRAAAAAMAPDSATGSDDERANVLAKILRTDSSAKVRRVAAWGLQRYAQTEVAQQALLAAASGDVNDDVREMSIWALSGARRSSGVGSAMAAIIRREKNAEVRETAVWVAGEVGDPAAVDALVGALGDQDPRVREMAAWSIGSCRPEKAPAALLHALSDRDRDVRESVAWALFMIRDAAAAPAIDAAFQHETDSDVQEGLVKALGSMGDGSVEALQHLVTADDPKIREAAITALAGGGGLGPWPWPRPQPRPFP